MDLTVGKQIVLEKEYKPGFLHIVNPYNQRSIDLMFSNPRNLPCELQPGQRGLLCTEETVHISPIKCGFIEIRSTWARLGLFSPPTLADPGFRGQLTFELVNLSIHAVLVSAGDKIWSMVLINTDEPVYQGRYQDQEGIQLPKALRKD